MSDSTKLAGDTNQPAAASFTQADIDRARGEGAQAERVRISAIFNCDEAGGRSKLAAHLAFATVMNADDAKAMLSASAQEPTATAPAASQANALAAGMAAVTNPIVGTDAHTDDPDPQAASTSLWNRSNAKLRAVK